MRVVKRAVWVRLTKVLLATCVAMLSGAACKKDRGGSRDTATTVNASRSAGAATPQLSDSDISAAVIRQLAYDPAFAGGVQATATAGVVELTGTVATLLAKQRATSHAEVVRGVRAVSNRIQVETPSVPDAALVANVRGALILDPAADAYDVSAHAREGVVTLKGRAQSWQEKQLAERVARGVKGVRDVTNQIEIQYLKKRLDAEIAQDIKARLRWDVLVQDGLLDVSVADGRVKLSGIVGSAAERTRAYWDAWVQGVRSVDNAAVEVRWWAEKRDLRKDKYVIKSGPEIARAVEDVLLLDPRVSRHRLKVWATRGSVTLMGSVDNDKARKVAEQLAKDTVGVVGVNNQIKISTSKDQPSDETVRQRIDSALVLNPQVDRNQIEAKVQQGKVTLTGAVDSRLEKIVAGDLVSSLHGVKGVDNQLEVRRDTIVVLDPYVYPYVPYQPPYPPRVAHKSDMEISRDIQTELVWSPFVDAKEVRVEVRDGTAILTGAVDSWRELASATENALEGGAIAVDNKLSVNPAAS